MCTNLKEFKVLQAQPALLVIDIAFNVGFRETSSFTSALAKLTGRTRSDYRRSLT